MGKTSPGQRLWLVGLGSHIPVIPGDILDMPGAPEAVRLVSLHGAEARVATSAGHSMVSLATVAIAQADEALVRPRPAEGAIDHREHRLAALCGAGEEEIFYVAWTSFDGLTAPRLAYMTELGALVAYLSCCSEPGNAAAQVVRRRPGEGDKVVAAFDRGGLPVELRYPSLNVP